MADRLSGNTFTPGTDYADVMAGVGPDKIIRPALIQPDGMTEISNTRQENNLERLLGKCVWELRELRKVVCAAVGQPYIPGPEDIYDLE